MTESHGVVHGGVDTHKNTHTAAVVDDTGRIVGSHTFPATTVGYRQLRQWMTRFGCVAVVGIEGTGSYGAGLARYLADCGIAVVEVNRPNRQLRRRHGKNDTVDAEAAARAALNGQAAGQPKTRDGIVESIRTLRAVFTAMRKTRTRTINQFHALLITAPDAVRAGLRGSTAQRIATAAAWRPGPDLTDPVTAVRAVLRRLARHHQDLTEQIEELRSQLDVLTRGANPALRAAVGVGSDVASQLLVTAGDNPERLTSEAAFAALCGVSPVEASSGKHVSHRLNRGGDRQANSALWRIVMVRMTCDPATIAYVEKRKTEGKSDRHIKRSLKRYVAREMFTLLTRSQPMQDHTDLRPARLALGITMTAAAEATPFNLQQLSRMERGLTANPQPLSQYRAWLHAAAAA